MDQQFNKAMIAPIIALIALVAKQAFHFEMLPGEWDIVTDGIIAIIAAAGFKMSYHAPKK